ncbi:MAG: glycine cleavage system aminomethyltransferase GcvT [Planctomycetaceae bacterium]|jgi:aminomethyltransferase|nr:glycine cleavage system aminomethyltransferase GcvT [Planctomycetaceae bacterium]
MLSLLRTPLYDWHCDQHAQMAEWDGWEMPQQYVSVLSEYEAARKHVGVTDLSHKGRLVFEGPGAEQFLNSLFSRNITTIKPGQLRYALLINEHGGILDDLLVGHLLREGSGVPYYYVMVNAANREKDIAYFKRFLTPEIMTKPKNEVYFSDETDDQSMIMVQGPNSLELLKPLFQTDISTLSYYSGVETSFSFGGRWALVSRTAYAGKDGFEIVLESFFVEQFVTNLFQQGRIFNIAPVGFAAIDMMRQESAIPFYGYELDESITPFEAGLSHVLHLDDHDFPSNKILCDLKMKTPEKIRIGLETSGEFPARNGNEIFFEQNKIGWVTSGTFSPTLHKNIAMGYVPYGFSQSGQILNINVHGKINEAIVVPIPFVNRRK